MKNMSTFASNQRAFRTNPKINPETGRTIKKNSKTYDELVATYGQPVKHRTARSASPKRSPKKSQTARSPVRKTKSPARSYRSLSPKKVSPRRLARSSPARLNKSKDIYTVLPEQSIVTVLHKIDDNIKQQWIESSPYVRSIANAHHLN